MPEEEQEAVAQRPGQHGVDNRWYIERGWILFLWLPDYDDPGPAAAQGVGPARLPMPGPGRRPLGQADRQLAALLHAPHRVPVLGQQVALGPPQRHGATRVPGPVAAHRHVAARGLVLQPQLGPPAAEPQAAPSLAIPAGHQGPRPALAMREVRSHNHGEG